MFDCSVAVEESGDQYPAKILRGTGASHSIQLRGSVPCVEDSYTGEHLVLKGVIGVITVPLCRVFLRTPLVTGWVTIGVQDSLPVTGVTFLLGNVIAGASVVPDPVVSSTPTVENNTGLIEEEYPDLFPLCAVTRSQTLRNKSQDVVQLLQSFKPLFDDVLGQCSLLEHDLVLLPGTSPIKHAPYRMSPDKREKLKQEVEYLLEHDLVERSSSAWASPCVLVPKPDGSVRMCTDYKKVNLVTRTDAYPLSRIDDIIDSVGQASFVTKLDLLKGYYQIKLSEEAKQISAFVTAEGLWQYKVMPFGLKGAPATFQRAMHIPCCDIRPAWSVRLSR
ncbi:uncharacterized protein K02A2.6-like [Homarus americanus]|uniref:uncharacterized protein K02A2.6-like n=1 Tax=Homarus americanus TaxID=6706 RepID=UPI001C483125|nr:uncharacterized protein K02A2.6-like [Homarus americanus]